MSSANFKQYDSRWGNKIYNGSSTMAQAGCAPTSIADIVYNIDETITPWKVAQWLKANGYAIYGNGTAWAGIPAALKHYGLIDVQEVSGMSDVYDYISRGYKAVFLTSYEYAKDNNAPMRTIWTTSGHFIAVTAYKHENGKHYFWTRDPGGRGNNGWHCYETEMRGWLPKIWVCKVPATEDDEMKKKRKKIANKAAACAWPYGTKKSKYKYPSGKRRKNYVKALKEAYGQRKGWGRQTKAGASCDVFVGTVVRASGIDLKFPRGLDEQKVYLRKSSKWHLVAKKHMKKGDIVIRNGVHIMIYMGGGRVANAHYKKKTYPIIEKSSKEIYGSIKVYRAS